MKKQKPTIQQIQEYLNRYNPLGLAGALVELINQHNHLIYKIKKGENRLNRKRNECCSKISSRPKISRLIQVNFIYPQFVVDFF